MKIIILIITFITLSITSCTPNRSYQITINTGKLVLYDGNRKVGELPFNQIGKLDSLLLDDNQ